MGHARVGIVAVPHDQAGVPFHAETAKQTLDVAFRSGGWLLVAREGVGARALLLGRGQSEVEGRQGIHEKQRGMSRRDVVRKPFHVLLRQRVGQGDHERVQVVRIVVLGLDLHHVVLLAQFLGHGPWLCALHGVEIESTEKPHVRGKDAELRSVRAGHHAQAAYQFVLDGQARIEESDDLFLGTAGDGDSREHVRESGPGAPKIRQFAGRDPEPFPGIPGLGRVHLGLLDPHLDPGASRGVQLLEDVHQVRTGLHVGFRYLGTHEGLDEHGTIRVQFAQDLHGLVGKGMEAFGGHVETDARPAQDDVQPDDGHDQRRRAQAVMDPHPVAAGLHGPVAAADKHHVEIQHEARDREVMNQAGEADDAAGEVVEGIEEAQGRDQVPQALADAARDGADEHEGAAEQGAQDEGDGHVRSQQGRQHADGDEGGAG